MIGEGFERSVLFLIILGIAFGAAVAIGIEHLAVWIFHHLMVHWLKG